MYLGRAELCYNSICNQFGNLLILLITKQFQLLTSFFVMVLSLLLSPSPGTGSQDGMIEI